jgi:hypothetical protein
MGFVPRDAEWYLAEIVQELTVANDPRNIVWRNLTLIHGESPDDAYEQALHLGRSGDTEYLNPAGKLVTIRFRGLSFLDVIHDPLEHGAELTFQSNVSVAPDDLNRLLLPKERLHLFCPTVKPDGPDVASSEIVQEVEGEVRGQTSRLTAPLRALPASLCRVTGKPEVSGTGSKCPYCRLFANQSGQIRILAGFGVDCC